MSTKSPGAWIRDAMYKSEMNEIGSETTRGAETKLAIEHGAVGRHQIAAMTGIHSSLTLDRYKSTWRDYLHSAVMKGTTARIRAIIRLRVSQIICRTVSRADAARIRCSRLAALCQNGPSCVIRLMAVTALQHGLNQSLSLAPWDGKFVRAWIKRHELFPTRGT